MIRRKVKILTSDVTYSNQANHLLGRRKTESDATTKTDTDSNVSVLSDKDIYSGCLTASSHGKGTLSPVVHEDGEESCLRTDDRNPTYSRVSF